MSNQHPKDPFASPALSLTLAGIFRGGGNNAAAQCNGGGMEEAAAAEISSENSGAAMMMIVGKSHSDDNDEDELDDDHQLVVGDDDDDDDESNVEDRKTRKKKKRKKYHRHTPDQIREMEALFKESPHPDEKQRQQLSKQLGLAPRQVKFWFQNRRTQIKAIQERHENSLLKTEIDKLRDENKLLRDAIAANGSSAAAGCCLNCGSRDHHPLSDEKHLRIENAKLKAEVENLRVLVEKHTPLGGQAATTSSCSAGSSDHHQQQHKDRSNNNMNKREVSTTTTMSLEFYSSVFGLEKTKIQEAVNKAMEELQKMASARDPLWVRSVETGREMLNYDEYLKQFGGLKAKAATIEASRDCGLVFVELQRLVTCFMDVNQWKEMFPCLIAKVATVDVICSGDAQTRNGAVQLMFAEVQMLTPMVATREVYFVRYCKQLSAEEWGIVDVSIDKVEENIDASLVKCRKRPSGCIIHDQSNGHCKVVWVEHLECKKAAVNSMYRTIVNSGLAFGAKHWVSALQLQCERLVFFMATNVPTKDSTGVATLAGRKSILRLAQRMTSTFCHAIGASSYHTWTKVSSKTGEDIRVSSRKNLNDPGEPFGVIMCAVSSVWLPVPPPALFDFLRDEVRRSEWDIMSNGGPVQSIANLAKGQDRGNAVTIQKRYFMQFQMMKSNENTTWILQDCCTNAYESMIVYAPVDIPGMQSVITGCDSSNITILPSGFSILHDGLDSRPQEEGTEGGSLLTIAFQILTSTTPAAKLTVDSVESVSALISCTLRNIKTALECEES
ncbi:Homeobox-leucine zipper protein GLABRA 2 [Linum perenne]